MIHPMEFRRSRPSTPLRDIVESIWVQENRSPVGSTHPSCVVPTGTIEILFHYGDHFSHVEPGGLGLLPRSYVTGHRTHPVIPQATGPVGIVLVSLFPWGLSSLFPGCEDLQDGYIDLALLIGRTRTREIEDRLQAATNLADRIRLVEAFLVSQRTGQMGDPRMIAASRWLSSTNAPRPVTEMAGKLSMSRRHFGRTFRSSIGLQPKLFSRIMRFQKAIRLRRTGNMPWTGIAVECGYADQAHLTHEVKRFSGRTPGEIGIERKEPDDYFNGTEVSRFFNTVYL